MESTEPKPPDPVPATPSGSIRLSVVIPAYRESDRIATTVEAVASALADLGPDGAEAAYEVIVVDDGSFDGTPDRALAAGADQVIVLPQNKGKGAAVRAGMLASRGRVAAFCDADLAYHPSHLLTLLAEVEAGYDAVIGNRRLTTSSGSSTSGLRAVGSKVVNRLAAAVLLAAPLDTQCGLKAFRGDVARRLFSHTRIDGFAFDIEVLHLIERSDWTLGQIPVDLSDTGDRSTVRLADVASLVRDLAKVRYWSGRGVYDHPKTKSRGDFC